MTMETYGALLERLGEVADIGGALSLLGWDQQTIMPPDGAATRARRMSTLTGILDEKFSSPDLGQLFESLAEYEQTLPYDSDEASIIRVGRRDYLENKLVPTKIKVAMSQARSEGYVAWVQAREASDFSMLQPHLERIVELNREAIRCVRAADDSFAEDYDVLVNEFEPKLTSSEITAVFDDLKRATVPLVKHVQAHASAVNDDLLHASFPVDAQKPAVLAMVKQLGFTDDSWKLDVTAHPFASSAGLNDIRITTRYDDSFFNPAWFGTMHEFGHGLYERQMGTGLDRTPLARGASMAFHESQSRMWENLIGRGRPFWTWALPHLQRSYPDRFANVSEDAMYRAVNALGPSLIRVEADELTYNLHIILRFEIERELFSGKIEVADLPAVWNRKFEDYFGLEVPKDAMGVLQDVHWGSGLFGYFATYALGNVVALQLWDRVRRELPHLDEQTSQGEFAELRDWLGANIHQHGRKYLPKELLKKVVGTDSFDARPLTAYLESKVAELYGPLDS